MTGLAVSCLLVSACTCQPTWFRSCGPARTAIDYDWAIEDGLMVVTINSIPPGDYEVLARVNTSAGVKTLGLASLPVKPGEAPKPMKIVLPRTSPPGTMPKDVFPMIVTKGRTAP